MNGNSDKVCANHFIVMTVDVLVARMWPEAKCYGLCCWALVEIGMSLPMSMRAVRAYCDIKIQ